MKNTSRTNKPEIFETFSFRLPGHIRIPREQTTRRSLCSQVTGDIFRWPEVKFKAAPAEPLDLDEQARLAILNCKMPSVENDVATACANAETALGNLAMLARDGNGKALWLFAELVKKAVMGLNQIATGNPDAVAPFARQSDRWPMLRSTAPLLCDDDELLKQIRLGETAGIQLDKYSKWKPDFAAAIASELIKHIQFIRLENPYCLSKGEKVEFSKYLPPFGKGSALLWWKFAEKFLLATYPKPEEVAELDALVTAKSKRKFPSTRRVAILEKIRARFLSFATYPS